MPETRKYRIVIESEDSGGRMAVVAEIKRDLPVGVGGELAKAVFAACREIESATGLPGPSGDA